VILPVCGRCASFATLHSGPVPARNAVPHSFCALRAPMRKPNLAEGAALARRKGFPIIFPA